LFKIKVFEGVKIVFKSLPVNAIYSKTIDIIYLIYETNGNFAFALQGKRGRFIDLVAEDEIIKCVVFTTFMSPEAGHSIHKFITER